MDPEYESKQKRCSIKKGQQVQVIVKESSSEIPQRGGNLYGIPRGQVSDN